MIIDTHMHLYDNKYDGIREDVIDEAINMGVKKMIAVGFDYESSLKAIDLANKYDFIYAAIGLHPSEVQKENDHNLSWIYRLAKNEKVIAIGEIGLDYYWSTEYKELQKEYFHKQLDIAKELDLPVIIHSRSAQFDSFSIVEAHPGVIGVFHCYSGSLEMADRLIKLGYYIGVGGVLTFKNAKEIKRVVEGISLDNILSETDSPYLSPHPHRGEINHPGYTKYVVEKIAEIKNEKLEYVEDILYKNAHKLFKLGD